MNEEKIKEVFSDEEFVNSLMEMETPEEVQNALAEKDVDLSLDEISKIAELLEKQINGELSDDELENVAGGMGALTVLCIYGAVKAIVVAAAVTHVATRSRW